MTKRDFIKRLGLLTTTAVVTPEILAEQSQVATTNEPVERMRFHADGRVTARDKYGNIIDITNFRNDT